MTEEEKIICKQFLNDADKTHSCNEYKLLMALLEQEPKTWSLDDAREDFMSDVYDTLDFLPTNNEANIIIGSFDRVTSGIKQEPVLDKITEIIEPLRHLPIGEMSDIEWQILLVIDKYKAESEE